MTPGEFYNDMKLEGKRRRQVVANIEKFCYNGDRWIIGRPKGPGYRSPWRTSI